MDFGPIDYANATPPPAYRCSTCGVHGCKLWREYQTCADYTELVCCDCAGKSQKKDVSTIDEDGLMVSSEVAPAPAPKEVAAPPAALKAPVIAEATVPEAAPPSLRSVEIAAATVQGGGSKLDLAMTPRLSAGEYLPITVRQLGQSWRRLRRMEARGPRTELDVPATMDRVARTGVWGVPALTARRVNTARLLLLVDQGGSMAPFHPLTKRIIESASHGSDLRGAEVITFHNHAIDAVERDGISVSLAELLASLPVHAGALFVSDAGAARRRYSTERVEGTRRMLAKVGARLRRMAWVNPVPRSRWAGTSAQGVLDIVPMFEATRAGFDAALRVLRGRRPFAHGASP